MSLCRVVAALLLALMMSAADARHPLEPADTSSPRATMESFLSLTQETARRYQKYREWPGPDTMDGLYQMRDNFDDVLDLSQVPPAARGEVAAETFVLLWEIMARLELPPPEEIPGAPTEKESGSADKDQADADAERPTRWQLPGTEITIARVEEGSREGAFLFSPETVAGARGFYEKVRDPPYLRPMSFEPLPAAQLLTGWMIPIDWAEALPEWANRPILGLLLWKWLVLVLLFGLALGLVIAVARWSRRGRWGSSVTSLTRRMTAPVLILVLNPVLGKFISEQINVSGEAAELPSFLIELELASAIAIIWIVWLTSSWIAAVIIASPRVRAGSVDAHLIRLAARSAGILATLVLLIRAANEVGVPVYGIVAGAGVSGLAIALAAKTTLENFMGTLNIYADRPVRVGDLCRYGEDLGPDFQRLGIVEEIGLRSTRIRGLDRTLTTIPNAEFSNLQIVNLAKRDRMWINTTLGLRYETTRDQLRFVLAALREMLHAHPKTIHTADTPISFRFAGFGDYSLDVFTRVYIRAMSFYELLPIKEDILLRVMEVVENAGTGFAFPSRTLYHSRDAGLDQERQAEAEKRVREWASAQTLPFPDMAEDERQRITDTLDYPPEGSPGADRD
jgi:MscS family membrane protein